MNRWLAGLLASLWLFGPVQAQPRTWQSHASYQSAQSVAVVNAYVYTATRNGLFTYHKPTGDLRVLTRQDGLSDVGISRLLYLPDQQRLLIAYLSGAVDFMQVSATGEAGAVTTLSTIATAPGLPDARTINHIYRIGTRACLSTDFGLVVLNLSTNDILDTYFSRRADGTPLPLYQTTLVGDSLYALTAPLSVSGTTQSIRATRFASTVAIADPANWRTIDGPPGSPTTLLTLQGQLSASVARQGIYTRQTGSWALTQPVTGASIRLFAPGSTTAPTSAVVATEQAIQVPGLGTFAGPLLTDPREVAVDSGRIWVADTRFGLLAGVNGIFSRLSPPGPDRDLFVGLYALPGQVIALPNGPQDNTGLGTGQAAASLYAPADNRWQTLTGGSALDRGFTSAAYVPAQQTLFLGTYGAGLWQLSAGSPSPTPVPLAAGISPNISSLATDGAGNLWLATDGSALRAAQLHVRRSDGTFQTYSAGSLRSILQIVPDDAGFLWLRSDPGTGLYVFDPTTNRTRTLSTLADAGNLLSNVVRTLVKDRNGAIWVGTDLGPTVFDDPGSVFSGRVNASPPILNRRRLLANEVVTALAVDGGNQKWIGTRTGLYHVSADGAQLLDSFTPDNSPLPSLPIQALAVEPTLGRVFVQTPGGLVSYQGVATEPAEQLTGLTIYPNPVRPDYTGSVGIRGLTDNATVKILDAGGQLVYETRSQGGSAVWDLRDYRGRAAQTGIYLIVVVRADGVAGLAGKLAVIR
ncbi:two-component regulator propeller domain-containing protein [Spirosoma luteolum]